MRLPGHAFVHIEALTAVWQLLWKELYYELNHHISAVDQQTIADAVVANNLEGKLACISCGWVPLFK